MKSVLNLNKARNLDQKVRLPINRYPTTYRFKFDPDCYLATLTQGVFKGCRITAEFDVVK